MVSPNVYLVGGCIGETFYSGDIWTVAKFLYNVVLDRTRDFKTADPQTQKRLLDDAYELIQLVTGKESEKK